MSYPYPNFRHASVLDDLNDMRAKNYRLEAELHNQQIRLNNLNESRIHVLKELSTTQKQLSEAKMKAEVLKEAQQDWEGDNGTTMEDLKEEFDLPDSLVRAVSCVLRVGDITSPRNIERLKLAKAYITEHLEKMERDLA